MYNLKGFITINALANNTIDSISPLGELSNVSMSYAIEKGYYSNPAFQNVELTTFTSKDDSGFVEASAAYTQLILEISQWAFDFSIAGSFSDDEEAFRQLLLGQFGDSIESVDVGMMTLAKTSWLPSYLKFSVNDVDEDNQIQIWFSDAAFQTQYDDYQIVIIPPLEPIDGFQQVKELVEKEMESYNIPNLHNKVLELTEGNPYTYLISKNYNWHDRNEQESTIPVVWTVAIYGRAGNNSIVIKDALAKWILNNSGYAKDDWIPVFPDIFTSTEFTIIPLWDKLSIPDETVRGSLYSPIVSYDEILNAATTYIGSDYIGDETNKIQVSMIHYKSLSFISCGGEENDPSENKLTELFPDYAVIPTTSIDFGRMSADTVAWIRKLLTAIVTAEEMDEYTIIDHDYSRMERNGYKYIAFDHNNILYLVLTRLSMLNDVPVE